MTDLTITPGCTVLIAGFDDIPSHRFLVEEVFEDCITGTALTGPLSGAIAPVWGIGWVFVSSAKEGQGLSPSLTPARARLVSISPAEPTRCLVLRTPQQGDQ